MLLSLWCVLCLQVASVPFVTLLLLKRNRKFIYLDLNGAQTIPLALLIQSHPKPFLFSCNTDCDAIAVTDELLLKQKEAKTKYAYVVKVTQRVFLALWDPIFAIPITPWTHNRDTSRRCTGGRFAWSCPASSPSSSSSSLISHPKSALTWFGFLPHSLDARTQLADSRAPHATTHHAILKVLLVAAVSLLLQMVFQPFQTNQTGLTLFTPRSADRATKLSTEKRPFFPTGHFTPGPKQPADPSSPPPRLPFTERLGRLVTGIPISYSRLYKQICTKNGSCMCLLRASFLTANRLEALSLSVICILFYSV